VHQRVHQRSEEGRGTLRLWQSTVQHEPHRTADWDLETEVTAEQVDEIVRLLLEVDYSSLPHEAPFLECYPRLYFEGPTLDPIQLDYAEADALLPEMQQVYDWFDQLLLEQAPEFGGPSGYCAGS
jgi:hypothetical protein